MVNITKEKVLEKVAELQKRYDELDNEETALYGQIEDVTRERDRVDRRIKELMAHGYRSLIGQYVAIKGEGESLMYVCKVGLYHNNKGDTLLSICGPRVSFKDYCKIESVVHHGVSFNISTDKPQYYLDGISHFSAKPAEVEVITREAFLEACQAVFARAMGCVDEVIETYLTTANDKNCEKHEN